MEPGKYPTNSWATIHKTYATYIVNNYNISLVGMVDSNVFFEVK